MGRARSFCAATGFRPCRRGADGAGDGGESARLAVRRRGLRDRCDRASRRRAGRLQLSHPPRACQGLGGETPPTAWRRCGAFPQRLLGHLLQAARSRWGSFRGASACQSCARLARALSGDYEISRRKRHHVSRTGRSQHGAAAGPRRRHASGGRSVWHDLDRVRHQLQSPATDRFLLRTAARQTLRRLRRRSPSARNH